MHLIAYQGWKFVSMSLNAKGKRAPISEGVQALYTINQLSV